MKLPSGRDASFSLLGICLGLATLAVALPLVKDFMEPRSKACHRTDIAPGAFAVDTGFQPYDSRVGFGVMRSFVCVATQIFHDLAVTAGTAGKIMGFGTFVTLLPVSVLMYLEAARPDAKGLIRYPIFIALIGQLVGISSALPLLWIPSYVLGRGTAPLSKLQIGLSMVPAVAFMIFAISTFFILPNTPLWTTSAGILAGPGIVLSFLPLWWPFGANKPEDRAQSAQWATLPYAATGVMSFLAYLWLLVYVIVPKVGLNPMALYHLIWTEASPCTKFMAIDLGVLWLATIVVIAYRKTSAALEALGLTFLFGPGAALALVLAGLQVADSDTAPLHEDKKQETTQKKQN